jgi:DNA-binding LacI/PurR family transcriptional regulator
MAGAAVRAGLRVPQDLAVVGNDDCPIAALVVPTLSSVRIDSIGLGRFVAGMALHLADGRGVPAGPSAVDATLVVRECTAPPG